MPEVPLTVEPTSRNSAVMRLDMGRGDLQHVKEVEPDDRLDLVVLVVKLDVGPAPQTLPRLYMFREKFLKSGCSACGCDAAAIGSEIAWSHDM